MRAVNLYFLTRNRDKNTYTTFENILSDRREEVRVKEYEFRSLQKFVEVLRGQGVSVAELDGFYYSYTIRQIGKEFDLLKVCTDEKVLNIELKSLAVSEEKIEKQLLKNRYYLSPLAPRLSLYTYVEETGILYTLKDEKLCTALIQDVAGEMRQFGIYEQGNLDDLFQAKDYLISPLNMPEEFLAHRYFLTQQQELIRQTILDMVETEEKEQLFCGITGTAGTGKTLLLYDLAKELSMSGRVCLIHCGVLCEGHLLLNKMLEQVDIIGVSDLKPEQLDDYCYYLVDEAQRMTLKTLDILSEKARMQQKYCIFSYDYFQILSKTEQRRNIPAHLAQLPGFYELKLSGRIRSNREMNAFIRTLLDLKNREPNRRYSYRNVDVLYAQDTAEAGEIIKFYQKDCGYTFIEYDEPIAGCPGDVNAAEAVGMEFDAVIITLTGNFRYNADGVLLGNAHPNPDYSYYRLLFQSVSRTREKLCIVIIGEQELFEKVLSIQQMPKKGSEHTEEKKGK